MSAATTTAPDVLAEIRRFAADWFHKLDIHAPSAEVVPLVGTDLEMALPEGPIRGRDAFRSWYEGVIAIFFNEVHELHTVEADGDPAGPEGAKVRVVVRWEASFWKPPSAWAPRLNMVARQRWTLGRDPENGGRLVIRSYQVDALDPLPGSAPLPTAPA